MIRGKTPFLKQMISAALLISLSSTLALSSGLEAVGRPANFRGLTLQAARDEARKSGKILLLDFTASWCGPCHRMETEVWSTPELQKWIDQNAVAIQIDVDKEKEVSAAMNVAAMPSVVVFSRGDYAKEFERQVGYQTAPELLKWLENVKAGNTRIEVCKKDLAAAAGKGGKVEVDARHKLGKEFLALGQIDEAADQFFWLWKHIPIEAPDRKYLRMYGVTSYLTRIAAHSAPVKEKLYRLRDEAEHNGGLDLVILNKALNEDDKTLAWFDKIKNDPARKSFSPELCAFLERLLETKNRWSDIRFLYPDLHAEVKQRLLPPDPHLDRHADRHLGAPAGPAPGGPHSEGAPPGGPPPGAHSGSPQDWHSNHAGRALDFSGFDAAVLYASLLAAQKDSQASELAQYSFKLKDSADIRKEFVLVALKANQPRREQLAWTSGDSHLSRRLQVELENWLINNGHWSEIYLIYPDLSAELKQLLADADRSIAEQKSKGETEPRDYFGGRAATLYVSLLAAGRDSQANKLCEEILRLRDSDGVHAAFVSLVLQSKQVRKEQLNWKFLTQWQKTSLQTLLKEEIKDGKSQRKGQAHKKS
jgi:thiol-disulfide isomerase/thioredoxin